MPIFHYFVWLKIRLEIRLNNVLDTKEPFFDYKRKMSESPKNFIFPKRLTHAFGQKLQIFLYLDLVKMKLEKMLNNFVGKQETFFLTIKTKMFESPKITFFQRS